MTILQTDPHAVEQAALAYASRGWQVVVLHGLCDGRCTCHKGSDCPSPAKHPRLKSWHEHATCDANGIAGYWQRWPHSNAGVRLGPASGICDVEFDDAEGEATATRLLGECHTPTFRSSRSTHRLFQYPAGLAVPSAVAKAEGLEIRLGTESEACQSVFPPSCHVFGVVYQWLKGLGPDDVEPLPFPNALVELMAKPADASGNGQGEVFTLEGHFWETPGVGKGERTRTLWRLIGRFLAAYGPHQDLMAHAQTWANKCTPPLTSEAVQKAVSGLVQKHMGKATRPAAPVSAAAAVQVSLQPIQRYQPFPLAALPEPLQGFIQTGSQALGCDSAMIALPLLAGVASAIGATRRIQLKPSWSESSVLWTAVVAESGSLKSPAQDLALGPLRRLQAWRFEEQPELSEQHDRNVLLYEVDLKEWKSKGCKRGEEPPEKPEEPTVARYVVNDVTIEALADRLGQNPRGLLSDCDELSGWIRGFDQYRGGKGGDVAKWLSIHRAGPLLVDRKTGTTPTLFIKHAAVSISGGIQPATLRRAAGQEHWENGLVARLLLAAPPSRRKRWTEKAVAPECIQAVDRVFARLLAIDFGLDENEAPAPVNVLLDADARESWITFYNEHAETQRDAEGAMASVLSKLEAVAPRIALLTHLVRWANGESPDGAPVDASSMETGITLARWFADEIPRVYAMLGESEGDQQRRRLIEWIAQRGGQATARDVQRGIWRIDSAAEAEAALNELVTAGDGAWQEVPTTNKGGRPTRVFSLAVAEDDNTWTF